ncbi:MULTISPECIES: hypothetical protein [unclassified Arenimonas]|uniref:hypothetical protein n=1 Tax=unclassified Arenimonas TaxID=2641713 RepID=UPI00086C0024|nr:MULTISPECIES: hypothetical protein [unclassified Arenimonas]ODS64775.1 MAG: hypothetical protein ABS41_01830 [Arenimonas sp. SCN 70-307]
MTAPKLSLRPLLVATVALSVIATSGCSWVRNKWGNEAMYQGSQQNKPLEVPPGLDTPSTTGAVLIPDAPAGAPVSTQVPSGTESVLMGIDSFVLADSVGSSWRRIGIALGKIDGVTIANRAQLLNSYEVSYKGVSVLLRAEAVGEQTRVVALGQDGQPIRTGVATELLALLKARLG